MRRRRQLGRGAVHDPRFHAVPRALSGEAGKAYPLRAAFRVGSRVLLVTTDAFAFER